jgi:hypothetical protein
MGQSRIILPPITTEILPSISRLLNQLPQKTHFALNSTTFGNDVLQRSDLLDVGCKRGLVVVGCCVAGFGAR